MAKKTTTKTNRTEQVAATKNAVLAAVKKHKEGIETTAVCEAVGTKGKPLSPRIVRRHLRQLWDAGLVECREVEGSNTYDWIATAKGNKTKSV